NGVPVLVSSFPCFFIPGSLFLRPCSLVNLVGLKVLSLYGNQLSGDLPVEINKITNLTLFYLSNNPVSGSLPWNLCHGGILQDFCASNNQFTGTVPDGLKNCTSLTTRPRLDKNQLVGNTSEDFGVYPVVKYMDLSNNSGLGGPWEMACFPINLNCLRFKNPNYLL
ncbi:hypothetical protein Dimus_013091, partial [Dionaea muscipula]